MPPQLDVNGPLPTILNCTDFPRPHEKNFLGFTSGWTLPEVIPLIPYRKEVVVDATPRASNNISFSQSGLIETWASGTKYGCVYFS